MVHLQEIDFESYMFCTCIRASSVFSETSLPVFVWLQVSRRQQEGSPWLSRWTKWLLRHTLRRRTPTCPHTLLRPAAAPSLTTPLPLPLPALKGIYMSLSSLLETLRLRRPLTVTRSRRMGPPARCLILPWVTCSSDIHSNCSPALLMYLCIPSEQGWVRARFTHCSFLSNTMTWLLSSIAKQCVIV